LATISVYTRHDICWWHPLENYSYAYTAEALSEQLSVYNAFIILGCM